MLACYIVRNHNIIKVTIRVTRGDYYDIHQDKLHISQSFCWSSYFYHEYINPDKGYGYPNSAIASKGYLIKDNGNVIAVITGEIEPRSSYLKNNEPVCLFPVEGMYSHHGCYISQKRSWSLTYLGESSSSTCDHATFSDGVYYAQSSTGQLEEAISIGISIVSIILGIASGDAPAAYLGLTSLALSLSEINPGCSISYAQNEVSCCECAPVSTIYACRCSTSTYCGFNGTTHPEYSFGERVDTMVSAEYSSGPSIAYDLSIFNFTESFCVFNKSSDLNSSPCTPIHLYSSTMTSPVYLQTCYKS